MATCGDDSVLEHVLDVTRHGGTEVLSEAIAPPKVGGNFVLDENVIEGNELLIFQQSFKSIWSG